MATNTSTVPGAVGGAVMGQRNQGVPVMGNAGGLNQFSPGGGNPLLPPTGGTSSLPGLSAVSTGVLPNQSQAPWMAPNMNMNMHPTAMIGPGTGGPGRTHPGSQVIGPGTGGSGRTHPGSQVAPGQSTATAPQGVGAPPAAPGAPNSQQQQQLQKQLIDIYGKGTGGQLANLINNLGSNDSQYMQAYQTAMAKVQAEGLSTIGTSLGNAGISSDSSTSAIEKGSYLSGLGAQAGMQEMQLLQQETGLKANLLAGTENKAAQEVGTSWMDTAGQVLGLVGGVAADAMGMGGIPGMGGGGGAPMLNIGGTSSQLPGSFGPPSMPAGIPYQPNLPGLDF